MIFEKVTLKNIFSYRGECVFDFSRKTEKKNIVLISGGNGFGKTSFLNAIKLLFTGVTNDLLSEVQRQRKPSAKQYIIGAGDDWWGVVNRHADPANTQCSIEIVWKENTKEVVAKREWIITNNTLEEFLTIHVNTQILEGDEAKIFLNERLPEEYVPFFFFDGEKIQELAEANVAQTAEHIERLLNISHVNNLRKALKDSIAHWRREGAYEKAAEAELHKLLNDFSLVDKKLQAEKQLMEELQYDLAQLDEEREFLQRKMESSRSFISQKDEGAIQSKIEGLIQEKESLLMKVVETLPHDIPLLANEHLLNKVQNELNKLLKDNESQGNHLAEQLLQFLPDDIFERPPFPSNPVLPLSKEQKLFYKNKLSNRIKEYSGIQESTTNDSLFKLSIHDGLNLQELIQPYLNSRLLRLERKQIFDKIQLVNNMLRKSEDERLNISSLSAEEKRSYEKLKEKLYKVNEERDYVYSQLEEIKQTQSRLLTSKENLKVDISKKEKELQLNAIARKKIDKAKKYQQFFSDYKDQLKQQRKDELEHYINHYFKKLMSSHTLIQKITLDEDFGIHYHDKDGLSVGMGNLSAGMKQLAATALLWALKTCSGKPMPIIVDTPMARIDKGNQENLLTHYYPKVSEQVIILPTDSEMDERKYKLLQPYIYREYVLENKAGDQSHPIQKKMYPEISEETH